MKIKKTDIFTLYIHKEKAWRAFALPSYPNVYVYPYCLHAYCLFCVYLFSNSVYAPFILVLIPSSFKKNSLYVFGENNSIKLIFVIKLTISNGGHKIEKKEV